MRLILAAAIAPPVGLLLLGATFNNTPIELRYLSFGLPFIALLAVWACQRGIRRRFGSVLLALILCVQFAGTAGLLLSSRTMQPGRSAAIDAARLAGDGVVLLPRGNDGVGIVGAFAIEAPPALPLLLVGSAGPNVADVAPYRRVVLALLGQDRDSKAAVAAMRAAFSSSNWRRVAIGSSVEVYERSDIEE
jgi:hypothetical protein